MIRINYLEELSDGDILNRSYEYDDSAESTVAAIIDDVRTKGDDALLDYTKRFDGVSLSALEVTKKEFDEALAETDPYFLETLRLAKENIAAFHTRQLHENFVMTQNNGAILGQRYTPVEKVGIYVPGGTAAYPSSVLMNAVPAKIAGVTEVVMVTPPDERGKVPSVILVAAKIAGVDRVFKIGGAQAVAALAYGTQSVPKVQKIVGPGNKYVATAKRRVFGLVDIDMIAGPSEILIVADETANPVHVAADLLSQAEHDTDASAVLITTSETLANQVAQELERQIPLLPRAEICRQSIDKNGRILIAKNLNDAVNAANRIAPEHLELFVQEPFGLLGLVKNAGSIFLGKNTPEALGDYFAGPNHVLPTGGTAKFSSPLSVDDFVKKSSFLYYTKVALSAVSERVADFAKREGLSAHAKSITCRFEEDA
ncbi:MAG: histidinol dehydrogenase [Christensenellales bacterium]|jgi:histidinol dehydrogenase